MINIAIQDLIIDGYGPAMWDTVKARVGIETEGFVSMHTYPDQLTYAIVGRASEVLGISPALLLEKIGEYWIIHTARAGYGSILDMNGDNIVAFLKNLNAMHSRLANVMPEMRIPTFEVSDITDHSLTLHYRSHRYGLEHMVVGLLRGLAKKFDLLCTVTMAEAIDTEGTYQKYFLTWR